MIVAGERYDTVAPFPPDHPMHFWRIVNDNGEYPLSKILDVDYPAPIGEMDRFAAQELLDTWEASKRPLTDPDVHEWMLLTLAYMRDYYANRSLKEPDAWNPHFLRYEPRLDPMAWLDEHAGVRHVRRFYPAFEPRRELFATVWTPAFYRRLAQLRGRPIGASCQ